MKIVIKHSLVVLGTLVISWFGVLLGSLALDTWGLAGGVLVPIAVPFILLFLATLGALPVKLGVFSKVNAQEGLEESELELEESELELELEDLGESKQPDLDEYINKALVASLSSSVIGACILGLGIMVLPGMMKLNEVGLILLVSIAYMVPYGISLHRLTNDFHQEEGTRGAHMFLYYATIFSSLLGVVMLTSFYSSTFWLGMFFVGVSYVCKVKLTAETNQRDESDKQKPLTVSDDLEYTSIKLIEEPELETLV